MKGRHTGGTAGSFTGTIKIIWDLIFTSRIMRNAVTESIELKSFLWSLELIFHKITLKQLSMWMYRVRFHIFGTAGIFPSASSQLNGEAEPAGK